MKTLLRTAFTAALTGALGSMAAEPVVLFDFRQSTHGWIGNARVRDLRATADGLTFQCTGEEDPWIEGPVVPNLPLGHKLRLTIRLRSACDNGGEVFFGPTFRAGDSARFAIIPDGEWHEYTMILPEQQPGARLRLDPAAKAKGEVTVAWIQALPLVPLMEAAFMPPPPVRFGAQPLRLAAGPLVLQHSGSEWNGFTLAVDGVEMASANADDTLGALVNGRPVMLPLSDGAFTLRPAGDGVLAMQVTFDDAAGATWELERRFQAIPAAGTIAMETRVRVSAERQVFHLPWVTLFPGLGRFGERKTQALLPGVEYLEDEPSSSEAEVRGPAANRRIVSGHKICFPMMALGANDRYVALLWQRQDDLAAVFDSPDRVFKSGAHLMGLWWPAVGDCRLESDFNVYQPITLDAGREYRVVIELAGGRGDSAVEPVQHYVRRRGLPPPPEFPFADATALLARGWLDSAGRVGRRWRHAVWGSHFPPQPAADAPAFMLWLAGRVDDAGLAERLRQGAADGLAEVRPGAWEAAVSHVRSPLPFLLFGHLPEYLDRAEAGIRQQLAGFEPDGTLIYRPAEGKPDYASTHYARHANGFGAIRLSAILDYALLSGKEDIRQAALGLVDKQTALYARTVPRGAQPWEMPLHTPDILASGRLVRVYVAAYLLSGDAGYLEQARYWAWTGVGMVYLDPPVSGPVGLYATIGVIGATNWVAPNWIGQPVQWCGLVYRSALEDLARVDAEDGALWRRLAAGITRSGLQQTFPLSDTERQGLLPDYFLLEAQIPDGPAISPGTVQASLPDAYGEPRLYAVRPLGPGPGLVHTPGECRPEAPVAGRLRLAVDGWPTEPYHIHLSHLPRQPEQVLWQGAAPLAVLPRPEHRALTVQVSGRGVLDLVGLGE